MGYKNKLAITLNKTANMLHTRSSSTGVTYDMRHETNDTLSQSSAETWLRSYQTVASAFDCVSTISADIASIPIGIWHKRDDGTLEECGEHPLLELLDNPNKLYTRFQLFEATAAFMLLTGNSFWFTESPDRTIGIRLLGSEPVRLHLERPDLVDVSSPNSTERLVIKRKINKGATKTYEMEDVVHFKLFNPLSNLVGMGPTSPSNNALVMELYLDVFGKGYYQNAVIPSSVFTTDGDVSNVSFERFKATMERHRGIGRQHEMLLLSGGIKPVDMKITSPQDSAYRDTQEITRDRVYNTFGCYHLTAIANGLSGEGIKEASRMYWRQTIPPRLDLIAQILTKQLLPKFGSFERNHRCFVKFDIRNVPGMREDFSILTTGLFRLIQAGILGIKEAREMFGLEREMASDDTTGLGSTTGLTHQPAVSRFDSNDMRGVTEEMTQDAIADKVVEKLAKRLVA